MIEAALIGVVLGAVFVLVASRVPARIARESAYVTLVAMLAIYIGAQLVSGGLTEVLVEAGGAIMVALIARVAMERWPPAIAVAILLHGAYDAIVGPHTGVEAWYPPLCAGFDFTVGTGLLFWRSVLTR